MRTKWKKRGKSILLYLFCDKTPPNQRSRLKASQYRRILKNSRIQTLRSKYVRSFIGSPQTVKSILNDKLKRPLQFVPIQINEFSWKHHIKKELRITRILLKVLLPIQQCLLRIRKVVLHSVNSINAIIIFSMCDGNRQVQSINLLI